VGGRAGRNLLINAIIFSPPNAEMEMEMEMGCDVFGMARGRHIFFGRGVS
jgi:hypothetical protein